MSDTQIGSLSAGYSWALTVEAVSLLQHFDLRGHSFDFHCFMVIILHEMKADFLFVSLGLYSDLLLINACSYSCMRLLS